MKLNDPFPASNPVAPSYGKSLGIYTMLGDSLFYFSPERNAAIATASTSPSSVNCRVVGAGCHLLSQTGPARCSRRTTTSTRSIPRSATIQGATLAVIENPFYNILPVEKFPGPLRYQPKVGVTSLAKPIHSTETLSCGWLPGGSMNTRPADEAGEKLQSGTITAGRLQLSCRER